MKTDNTVPTTQLLVSIPYGTLFAVTPEQLTALLNVQLYRERYDDGYKYEPINSEVLTVRVFTSNMLYIPKEETEE